MKQPEIDEACMQEALARAGQALEEGEFPVGCVIARQGRIIAAGRRRCSRGPAENEIDHAEMVALKRLYAGPDRGPAESLTLYATLEPCLMCFGAVLISGIRRIVYAYEDVMGGGTACRLESLPPLYRDVKIRVVPHVLREQSLALFRRFFSDPKNTYLQASLLAEYTRCQR